MSKIVYKPWGKEEWLELNQFYCYKRIYINAGHKTSFQYHNEKYETNYIISGTAEIWLEDDNGVVQKTIMYAGQFFNVAPPKKHRVIALTDIILQEVSTPHVDDVIRIEDDTKRPDGKIESEHKTPAVLILCAGLGSRLQPVLKNINKVLLPINNKAVISHIIESFPKEYDIVLALGYKGTTVQEYCELAHADRNISFVYVDDFTSDAAGPGYSALQCKDLLQRPFYFITGDCLLEKKVPLLSENWLGVIPTEFPEKYSTVSTQGDSVIAFKNKSSEGYDKAFIGLAGIVDYDVFWKELETNITSGEIVSAFVNPSVYPTLKTKELPWFDTGNVDDLIKTRQYFNDAPLSLNKNIDEFTYKVSNKFIKYFGDTKKLSNLKMRSYQLEDLVPKNIVFTSNFLCYDWVDGATVYQYNDIEVYKKFLEFLSQHLCEPTTQSESDVFDFYVTKTQKRLGMFLEKFGNQYYTNSYCVNNKQLPSMKDVFEKLDFSILSDNSLYTKFHGDLQFDNIIFDGIKNFYYIDWRESFGNNIVVGDQYYDFAKLLGGLMIPYNMMKDDSQLTYIEAQQYISYAYAVDESLTEFLSFYKKWLTANSYDLRKVLFITGLIFLNMSPLHDENFSKLLWFKALEMLNEYHNAN